MKISVAIGTHNRATMALEAVAAALAQSRLPDEIVVSDDASSDDTYALLRRLGSPRLHVFRQETNLGGASNANFAIRQTSGEFIAWCSDDDRFLPDHLEASLAYLEGHPEVGLVHAGFIDAIEAGGPCEMLPRPRRSTLPLILRSDGLMPYLIRYYNWPFHPSTLVMRRQVWERVGGFNNAFALSDTDWFVRAIEQFPAAMLPRPGVINRRHPGNWSNRVGSARMQREIFEIVESSIFRRWPNRKARRMFWRSVWRANVRLRLAMTLRIRIKTGHGDAARAALHGLLQDTGRRTPQWVECLGANLIDRWCAGREPEFEDVRQSVSPL